MSSRLKAAFFSICMLLLPSSCTSSSAGAASTERQQNNANDAPGICIRNTFKVEEALKILKAGKYFLFKFLFAIIPYQEDHTGPDPDLEEGGGQSSLAVERRISIRWSTLIITYCLAWVVGHSFMPEETKLRRVWLYNMVTITATLAFGSILVAHLISVRFPMDAHAILVVGILFGVLSFFMAASTALSLSVHSYA